MGDNRLQSAIRRSFSHLQGNYPCCYSQVLSFLLFLLKLLWLCSMYHLVKQTLRWQTEGYMPRMITYNHFVLYTTV